MPTSYSLNSAMEVVDLLKHEKTRAALKETHSWIISMALTLSQQFPEFDEAELEYGEPPLASSQAVFHALDQEGAKAKEVLQKRVIRKITEPVIINLEDLWDEFVAQMRVPVDNFEIAYALFVGNVGNRLL